MDGGDSSTITGGSKEGFINHVFNFDEDSKREMMNIVQYTLVGLIPVVLLNKTMQKYVPEADDDKGSVELLAEVCIQIIIMFLGILIVHRIITFVPTYSGVKYEKVSIVQIILSLLMITLSLQTKLGEKVSILADRIGDVAFGKSREGLENKKDEDAKKTQGNAAMSSMPPTFGMTGTTSIAQLTQSGMQQVREPVNSQPQQQQQQSTEDFIGGMAMDGGGVIGGGIEAFSGF
jgi:hypothetical protein